MKTKVVDSMKAVVLAKATLRAAAALELTTGELATVLWLPEAEVER